jgi:hypothetical protein
VNELAEPFEEQERPWLIRPYEAGLDEDGMMSFLSGSYCRSDAGRRAGATGFTEADAAGQERRRAFQALMRPTWAWLLANCDVSLAVDPENTQTSIWAWLVTSGPDVLHAVGCKRNVIASGVSREMVLDLLGHRWESFQVVTLELPQLRKSRLGWKPMPDWLNLERPSKWTLDPSWLAARVAK